MFRDISWKTGFWDGGSLKPRLGLESTPNGIPPAAEAVWLTEAERSILA